MIRGRLAPPLARAVGALFALASGTALAVPPQEPLPGAEIPKYVDPVPTFAGQRVGGPLVLVSMKEVTQKPLPESFYARLPRHLRDGTVVWGYQVAGLDAVTNRPASRPASWPGFTVEARRFRPTIVVYENDLRTPKLQALLPVDQTLHWADPLGLGCVFQGSMSRACMRAFSGPVPTVVHLHGSQVPAAFDGGPDQWFTLDGRHGGNYSTLLPVAPNRAMYRYPNGQEGTTLWFHDHALGTTRLNVYGGIAAFYFVRDDQDTGRPDNPLALPAGDQEVELVIQDRSFDRKGQLLYFDPGEVSNPEVHPWWRPEFFGDVIVVNGKSWPRLDVEPRRHRLRFLNGSNARFYNLALQRKGGGVAPAFYQIGTDGGRLDSPVPVTSLLIAPGERADVIVDFGESAGATFTVTNDANAPYPDGDPVDPETTAQVMQIRVLKPRQLPVDRTCDPAGASGAAALHTPPPRPCDLRPDQPIVRLADPATGTLAPGVNVSARRQLILREVVGPGGPLEVLVNNTKWGGFKESTLTSSPQPVPGSTGLGGNFATEAPLVGSTEVWEVANLTVDGHPIHLHLVQFQIVNRQALDTGFDPVTEEPVGYVKDWMAAFPGGVDLPGEGPPLPYGDVNSDGAIGGNLPFGPYLQGAARGPEANEAGWKDTVVMLPGEVTRIAVRWAPQDLAVGSVTPGMNLYEFDPSLTDPRARDRFGNPGAAGYVWHCHILEHEDNEMMRPYAVVSR